jgi:HTH-type transcriptional regulator, glycine betaine synthesis regulator
MPTASSPPSVTQGCQGLSTSAAADSGSSFRPQPSNLPPAEQFSNGLAEVFSDLADLFGNPRSVGAIYGLLFSSEDPLTMDLIATRLGLSMGSVSQGLRTLEDFGAIERHGQNGERTARTYRAKHMLKPLIAGFVGQRLVPRLEASSNRLMGLEALLNTPSLQSPTQVSSLAFRRSRLERVVQWHDKARTFLPLARKILGAG